MIYKRPASSLFYLQRTGWRGGRTESGSPRAEHGSSLRCTLVHGNQHWSHDDARSKLEKLGGSTQNMAAGEYVLNERNRMISYCGLQDIMK